MESIMIEALFILLFVTGIGAYVIGKKKNLVLLKALGIRSSFVMFFMLIVYTWMTIKRDY
jgi:hypothetical protein